MFSFQAIVLVAAASVISVDCSGVPAVAALAAPPVFEYAHAVPDNIPPYAAQINLFRKALGPLIAAPVAPPFAARVAHLAPYATLPGYAPAPYLAGPAPAVSGPGASVPAAYAALAATSPYAWPAPAPYAAPVAAAPYAPYTPYAPSPYLAPAPYAAAPALVR